MLRLIDFLASYWLVYRTAKPEYRKYINSPAWRYKANRAKKRAGYRCSLCNSSERLEVHHRTYNTLGNEPDNDLVVLCRKCHRWFHKVGE